MRSRLLLILLCVAIDSIAVDAQTEASSEDRLQRMERALDQLQRRNAELEEKVRRLEAREASTQTRQAPPPVAEQRGAKEVVAAAPAPAPEQTPAVRPIGAGSIFNLKLGGFIQAQADAGDVAAFTGLFSQSPALVSAADEVDDRFLLRRARLTLTGDYAEQLDFKLEIELFSGTNARATSVAARDVSVNWKPRPELNLKVGQFKTPFGREQLTSDSRLISIEPSLVTTALVPDRQVGLQVSGQPLANISPDHADVVTYYAGVFNGSGSNTALNDNEEFMYAGRLEVLALRSRILNQEASVRFGASGLTSRDGIGTRVSPAVFVNEDGTLSPFEISPAGGREAYGIDAALQLGGVELIAEYINARIYLRELGPSVPQLAPFRPEGYYVQGSYFLVPEKLQLVTKWESFNPDQLADDDIHSITAGVNYYLRGHNLKLMANYIHTWSDFRAANPQFGRDEFDQVTLRLQVMF